MRLIQNMHRFTLRGIGRHVTLFGVLPIIPQSEKQGELEGHSESADLRQAAHIDTKMSTQATRSYNQD